MGVFFLDQFSQGQAGNVLVECRGKAHDIKGSPVAGIPGPLKKFGNHFGFYIDQILLGALNGTANLFNMRIEVVYIILIPGIVPK